MKVITPMIVKKDDGYYMKEGYCVSMGCKYNKVVPISSEYDKCIYCKRRLRYRWKYIGDTINEHAYRTFGREKRNDN